MWRQDAGQKKKKSLSAYHATQGDTTIKWVRSISLNFIIYNGNITALFNDLFYGLFSSLMRSPFSLSDVPSDFPEIGFSSSNETKSDDYQPDPVIYAFPYWDL